MLVYILVLLIIFSFISGGFPSGKIIAKKVKNINIQEFGSGNTGATNIKRALGLKWAILVFWLDFLKCFIPTLIANLIFQDFKLTALVGLVSFLGHIYSPFLKFKGGKGVASGAGVLAVLAPIPTFITAIWIILVAKISGKMSVSSLSGLICIAVLASFTSINLLEFVLLLDIIIIYTHRENIKRLFKGEELNISTNLNKS